MDGSERTKEQTKYILPVWPNPKDLAKSVIWTSELWFSADNSMHLKYVQLIPCSALYKCNEKTYADWKKDSSVQLLMQGSCSIM